MFIKDENATVRMRINHYSELLSNIWIKYNKYEKYTYLRKNSEKNAG